MLRALTAVIFVIALATNACFEEPSDDAPVPLSTNLPILATATVTSPSHAIKTERSTRTDITSMLHEIVCWYDNPKLAADCLPVGIKESRLLSEMAATKDQRFIAPLVDMLSLELGWSSWIQETLTIITGHEFKNSYDWAIWISSEPPPLPDGYIGWKGHLLSIVDERYIHLLNDELLLGVRPEEFVWSRLAIDEQIPLTNPRMMHRQEQRYLSPDDVVFGVFLNGQARAYPQRILAWHELVYDEVGGDPLFVTNCVPCGGTAVYEAIASDSRSYHLGNTGLVYHSRHLFYDTETHSLWDQLTGDAITGDAFASEVSLIPIPVVRTTWEEWSSRHPSTAVLSLDTGTYHNYDSGAAIAEEIASAGPYFPAPIPVNDNLEIKERVLGLEIEGSTRAYPLSKLEAAGIVQDSLAGQDIVLISQEPGRGVSVYQSHDILLSFVQGPLDALEAVDNAGERWFLDEAMLVNVIDGRVRHAIPARIAYWFAWANAFPETTVWED